MSPEGRTHVEMFMMSDISFAELRSYEMRAMIFNIDLFLLLVVISFGVDLVRFTSLF